MAVDCETRLEPCPFCGNPNVLLRDTEYDRTLWIIECNQCHMEVAVKHRDVIKGRRSTHDDLVAGWNRRTKAERPKNPTNWDYIKAAIDDEIDDGGAARESTIFYNIACPYYGNNPEAHCHGMKETNRDMCSACKAEWLEKEYEG